MINVLCFGDSNSWGYQPLTGERYPFAVRWTGRLQHWLGNRFRVVENGLNGRTTCIDEPGRSDRNGLAVLPMLLECHRPLDIVVIMLGTNDLKACFDQSTEDVCQNAMKLCQAVKASEFYHDQMEIILVSPTLILELPELSDVEFAAAHDKSSHFGEGYKQVAKDCGVHWFDASSIVHTTNSDGVHWESYQHNDFAKALSLYIQGVNFAKR